VKLHYFLGGILIKEKFSSKTEKSRLIKPNQLAAAVSLFIHLIGFLFAMFYVIETRHNVEDYVEVDIAEVKRPPKLLRRPIPHASKIQPIAPTEVQTSRLRNVVGTIADIPTEKTGFVLPQGEVSPNSLNLPDNNAIAANMGISVQINPSARVIPPVRVSPKVTLNSSSPKFQIVNPSASAADVADLTMIEILTTSLNEAIEPPKFIHKVVPEYPDIARRAEKDGIVILEAEIGIDGVARDIKVIQKLGYDCDEAAISALKASKFSPAKRGGTPAAVRIQIPYRFQFED
jgi:TonB family protein